MINQSTQVLHGEGEPRIVIPEDTAVLNGYTTAINDLVVTVSSATLTDAILNKQLITTNNFNVETKGKIIAYNNTTKKITVKEWDNLKPIAASFSIRNEVIDLPYCQELYEAFTPIFYAEKELWDTGELIKDIRGFRYRAQFNYSKYINAATIAQLQNIYNANRVNKFWVMPRQDNMAVYYKCEIGDDDLELAQLKFFQGHKYVSFNFKGLELVDGPNLRSTKHNKVSLSDALGNVVSGASGTGIS